ncbi:MAG: LptF/LptG family permease [Candidatus Hydrothermales bacterium]
MKLKITISKVDKYIFFSLIPPFLYSIILLLMIMLLDKIFDLADLVFKKKIPFIVVLEILSLSIPYMLALVIPMSMLVSTLYVFGNLGQDREILALSTSGISLLRITRVPLFFSIILFLFLIYFNGFFVPNVNHLLKQKIYYMYRYRPSIAIKEGVFNEIGNMSIYIEKKEGNGDILKNIRIFQKEEEISQIINAKEGLIERVKNGYILILKDGMIKEKKEGEISVRRVEFKEYKIYIEDKREEEIGIVSKSDRELTLRELLLNIERNLEKLRKNKEENKFLFLETQRYWVEVHKKFSIPFASIVFVIIGIPLAKIFGKAGWGSAFGISIIVFTIHYILLVVGEELADRGMISTFLAMWTGNILTLLTGIYLLYKTR